MGELVPPMARSAWTYDAARRVLSGAFPVLEVHTRLDSTMARAKTLAMSGAPSGTMVLCDEQTAGRGRLGRRWQAPARTALLVSVILRPSTRRGVALDERASECSAGPVRGGWILGTASALALVRAVDELAPKVCPRGKVVLKWPNDVLIGDAKLAGVLVEQGLEQGLEQRLDQRLDQRLEQGLRSGLSAPVEPSVESASDGSDRPWAVLGMGVNLSWAPPVGHLESAFPAPHVPTSSQTHGAAAATSLETFFGEPVDRYELLRAWSTALAASWSSLERGETEELRRSWRSRLSTLGRSIRVERIGSGPLVGVARDVDRCGRLVVCSSNGTTDVIDAGDVMHLRSND